MPHPEGESLEEFWKRRLPLIKCMTGKKTKGSATRTLGDAIARLEAKKDSDEALEVPMLRRWEGKCRLACRLHPKSVAGVPFADCQAVLATLVDEEVSPPKGVYLKILDKRCVVLLQNNSWEALWRCMDAFAPHSPLSSVDPALSCISDLSAKVDMMTKNFFLKALVHRIMEGDDSVQSIKQCIAAGLPVLDRVDLISLDEWNSGIVTAMTDCLRCLDGLLHPHKMVEAADAFTTVKDALKGKDVQMVLHKVSS